MEVTESPLPRRLVLEEKIYRSLLANIPEVAWTSDAQGRIVYVSPKIEKLWGFTPEEIYLQGETIWTDRIHPDDLPGVQAAYRAMLVEGRKFDVQHRVKHKDGRWLWVHDRAVAVSTEEGKKYTHGLLADITERKANERRLAAQYAITRILAESATFKEATPKIFEAIGRGLGWDIGALWLAFPQKKAEFEGPLRCVESWRADARTRAEFEVFSQRTWLGPYAGLPGKVFSTGKPVWVSDLTQEAAGILPARRAVRYGLRAAFGFPILLGREVVGVIEFFSRDVIEPDNGLLQLMAAAGAQIGQFLRRRRSDESSRESGQIYRQLFDNESDAVLIFDSETGEIEDANPAALALFGYSKEEMLRLSFCDITADGAKWTCQAREREAARLAGDPLPRRVMRKKGGDTFPGEALGGSFTAGGRVKIIGSIRDTTERERAQEAQALREREQFQREFIANVSHEFRTPVAAIKGFAETLRRGGLEDRRHRMQFVRTIERHAERLAQMVEDLLTLSALESGKKTPQPEPVALAWFAQNCVRLVAPLARQKKIAIRSAIRAGVRVLADKDHLFQILQNLLDNAIKYNQRGGWIEVGCALEQDTAVVWVKDSGIGISQMDLPLIFNRFHRGQGVSGSRNGTGLGLSIVKQLAEANGGRVWTESQQGVGSTFYLALPLSA